MVRILSNLTRVGQFTFHFGNRWPTTTEPGRWAGIRGIFGSFLSHGYPKLAGWFRASYDIMKMDDFRSTRILGNLQYGLNTLSLDSWECSTMFNPNETIICMNAGQWFMPNHRKAIQVLDPCSNPCTSVSWLIIMFSIFQWPISMARVNFSPWSSRRVVSQSKNIFHHIVWSTLPHLHLLFVYIFFPGTTGI